MRINSRFGCPSRPWVREIKKTERENKIRERRHSKAHLWRAIKFQAAALLIDINKQPQQTRNEVATGKTQCWEQDRTVQGKAQLIGG